MLVHTQQLQIIESAGETIINQRKTECEMIIVGYYSNMEQQNRLWTSWNKKSLHFREGFKFGIPKGGQPQLMSEKKTVKPIKKKN